MIKQTGILLACCAAALLTFPACEKEGPAERAGKKVDKAVEKTGKKVEKLGDKIEDSAN